MKLTQTSGPNLGGKKTIRRKNSTFLEAWEKETSNTISSKKIMKSQRNTTQMKQQTRNTEVQISEQEIGKLLEKEFRIMIVKMIINLENKMEKIQESINKDLEELMATHSSVLAWRIPGTVEPGGLPSMGSHRVRHN